MIECPMCQSTQVKVEWDVRRKLGCDLLESYLVCLQCRKCTVTMTSQVVDKATRGYWVDEKDR